MPTVVRMATAEQANSRPPIQPSTRLRARRSGPDLAEDEQAAQQGRQRSRPTTPPSVKVCWMRAGALALAAAGLRPRAPGQIWAAVWPSPTGAGVVEEGLAAEGLELPAPRPARPRPAGLCARPGAERRRRPGSARPAAGHRDPDQGVDAVLLRARMRAFTPASAAARRAPAAAADIGERRRTRDQDRQEQARSSGVRRHARIRARAEIRPVSARKLPSDGQRIRTAP